MKEKGEENEKVVIASMFDPVRLRHVTGTSEDTYVYLYAMFGKLDPNGFLGANKPSEDGFEEYVLREGGQPIPDPSTMLLLGSATLMGLVSTRRKFRK